VGGGGAGDFGRFLWLLGKQEFAAAAGGKAGQRADRKVFSDHDCLPVIIEFSPRVRSLRGQVKINARCGRFPGALWNLRTIPSILSAGVGLMADVVVLTAMGG